MGQLLYYRFYKPFDVLSQFTKEIPSHRTLADYLDVPSDVYPIGRLDRDSEGLLLLSNDKKANSKILSPEQKWEKEYYIQVEGAITIEAIRSLRQGVRITVKKKSYQTLEAKIEKIKEPKLPPRNPPIRERKSIPTTWLSIILHEGKNRQVRRMFASVGFPVLRLVRYRVGAIKIDGLSAGEWQEIDRLK